MWGVVAKVDSTMRPDDRLQKASDIIASHPKNLQCSVIFLLKSISQGSPRSSAH